jgi:tetratricopeptide (TPR) repeat protein
VIERLLEAERAMSVGLLDQAEQLYQQAWEADPHNSIAVAGLARVALERGDEPTAHALGLRALEIDEDNPAARRLVDRLVEVQATRAKGRIPPGSPAPPATAKAQPERPKPQVIEKSRPDKPHVAPPAAIRTSSSGKRRTSPPPTAGGPTLPKARPLSPPAPKPPPAERAPAERAAAGRPPAERRPANAPQPGPAPARPTAKPPAAPKPDDTKPPKEPGLLDRLFGPRR